MLTWPFVDIFFYMVRTHTVKPQPAAQASAHKTTGSNSTATATAADPQDQDSTSLYTGTAPGPLEVVELSTPTLQALCEDGRTFNISQHMCPVPNLAQSPGRASQFSLFKASNDRHIIVSETAHHVKVMQRHNLRVTTSIITPANNRGGRSRNAGLFGGDRDRDENRGKDRDLYSKLNRNNERPQVCKFHTQEHERSSCHLLLQVVSCFCLHL